MGDGAPRTQCHAAKDSGETPNTRSAEQAIDEAQAKLGERCERLLASSAWNKAHTTTHKGLLKRLQMIPDAGLNPKRVVAHRTLRRLGRIPRSHEGHQEDAIAAVL